MAQVLPAERDLCRVIGDAEGAVQVDGEDLGDVAEAVFEAERRSISVLV